MASSRKSKMIVLDAADSKMAFLDYMLSALGPPTAEYLATSSATLIEFAAELKVNPMALIEQFEAAGVNGLSPRDRITEGHKQRLLEALRARRRGEKRKSDVLYEQKLILPDQRIIVEDINAELLDYLSRHPEFMHELSPRKFELLVAQLFSDHGFEVEVTPATRDGGYDIFAKLRNPATCFVALVECKKYSRDRRVGVEVVRGLYGVTEMNGANQGLVVTSSFFTRGAVEEKARIGSKMELRDYDALSSWLSCYRDKK